MFFRVFYLKKKNPDFDSKPPKMLLWIFEQKMDFCISVYQSKDEEDGNYQRFSSNLHLFLQRGGGKFNYNLHRTILYSTILTLESGFLTLNERDRHSTHKNTSFSWRQPSYVILFHRNMEMEKWNIVKLDDKWSTFCHVQFHFSFFSVFADFFAKPWRWKMVSENL